MNFQWYHYWSAPFVALLLCIALLPLFGKTEHWWEHNKNKLLVALALGVPTGLVAIYYGFGSKVLHLVIEYVQFMSLLGSLFVVGGGICIKINKRATPWMNAVFLTIGTVIASFTGTTGAAMLLIRPLLQTNQERRHVAHTVVFFIFCVANCGGLLTPLGDPPLFMGYLRGVPFMWTFGMIPMWVFVNGLLIVMYMALDMIVYTHEERKDIVKDNITDTPFSIKGWKLNGFLLVCIVALVGLGVPSTNTHGKNWWNFIPFREIGMWAIIYFSMKYTTEKVRKENQFSFHAILEVAALFIGIFITMGPALVTVEDAAPSLPLNKHTFYFFTGGLSGFLDNAPTYITFFKMGATLPGDPRIGNAPGVPEIFLLSISLGAVFWGALTYIGNGPNFMVKAIADESGVKMPSFFGYFKYSLSFLAITLVAMYFVFINTAYAYIGWLIAGVIIVVCVIIFSIFFAKAKRMGLLDAGETKPA